MEHKSHKNKIEWKNSEKGRVCKAIAIAEDGNVIAEAHIAVPSDMSTELFKVWSNLGDELIEKAALEELKFKLDNDILF